MPDVLGDTFIICFGASLVNTCFFVFALHWTGQRPKRSPEIGSINRTRGLKDVLYTEGGTRPKIKYTKIDMGVKNSTINNTKKNNALQ